MSSKHRAFALALVTTMAFSAQAWPTQAWAYGGGGLGCSNLPEYDRAIGALQGLSVCDMSIEEARRIVAAHGGRVYQPASPDQPVRRRHHRAPALEQ